MTNEHEFLKLVDDNRGIVYKVINLYANDLEDKKDLYQEIIFQAWKSFPNFRSEAKFSTWLYKVSLNVSLTFLTKTKKRSRATEGIDAEMNVEQFELSERAEILYRAIRTLNELDRGIIMLHLDGYDNTEISEIAGLTKVNTGVKLHRIKQQLATLLNQL